MSDDTRIQLVGPSEALQLAQEADLKDRLEEALLAFQASLRSKESRRAYRDEWRRWLEWIAAQGVHVLAARALHVLRYLTQLRDEGKADSTCARALAVIRSTYAALVVAFSDIDGVLDVNPAREIKNIKVGTEPRTPWLSEGELRRLLERPASNTPWTQRRDWLICTALTGLGWRRSEIARLRRDAFVEVPGGLVVHVLGKGKKERFVPVPTWLSRELLVWCDENAIVDGPVFPPYEGDTKAIGATTVYNAVKRAADRAGVDVTRATPHAIRRSFATIARQRGISIEELQVSMLHESKTTTERYDHAARLPKNAPGEVFADLVGAET